MAKRSMISVISAFSILILTLNVEAKDPYGSWHLKVDPTKTIGTHIPIFSTETADDWHSKVEISEVVINGVSGIPVLGPALARYGRIIITYHGLVSYTYDRQVIHQDACDFIELYPVPNVYSYRLQEEC